MRSDIVDHVGCDGAQFKLYSSGSSIGVSYPSGFSSRNDDISAEEIMFFERVSDKEEFLIRFFLSLILIGLFAYPIIHANFYLIDDHGRALYPYIGMAANGRYLSELLFIALNATFHQYDIAPLTQILSVAILSLALTSLSTAWRFNRLSGFLALSSIVCSPYFLENLSYRVDSLYQSMALATAVAALSLSAPMTGLRRYLTVASALFLTVNLYQPAVNMFLVLLCLSTLFQMLEGGIKAASLYYVKNLLCLVAALCAYKAETFLLHLEGFNFDYLHLHAATTFNPHIIARHIAQFVRLYLNEYARSNHARILLIGLIGGVAGLGLQAYRSRGVRGGIFAILMLGVAVISMPGVMTILAIPVFDVRVLMSGGVFLGLATCFLIGRHAAFRSWRRVPILLSGWMLLTQLMMAYEWGNAAHAQALFENRLAAGIVEDIYTASHGQPVALRVFSSWGDSDPVPVDPKARVIF
ncbi:MAG: glucosyltransferase domain-containing protein [Acetobacteraceae bacterium]